MQQLTFIRKGRLEWREVPEPQLSGAREALVRPLAVARCDLDAAILFGKVPIRGPFALGHEFVAEVIACGESVKRFRSGQKVVQTTPFKNYALFFEAEHLRAEGQRERRLSLL